MASSEEQVENATKIFKELATIPSISKGHLHVTVNRQNKEKLDVTVTSQWTQRDLVKLENRKFQRNHIVTCDGDPGKLGPIQESSFAVELNHVQIFSRSPSGQLFAVVKKTPATKKEEEKQYLEVWSSSNLVKCIDIKAEDKHGDICEDIQFSSLQWSASEDKILYVAEKKKEKFVSYFEKSKEDKEKDPKPLRGGKFEYEESWGEQLTNRFHPILAVYNIKTDEILVVDGIPDDLSAGQAIWGPDEKGVVFSGWYHEPQHLGLIYCTNRRSGIFYVALDGSDFRCLSNNGDAVFSPKFSPNMEKLYYLARKEKGVHKVCARLMEFDWKSKSSSVVVDIVQTPQENCFPGIYSMGFPPRCWNSDGTKIILSSFWKSNMKIIAIDVNSKSVFNCTKENGCWNVLDVYHDFILASFSSPRQPNKLMISPLPDNGKSAIWTPIAGPEEFEDIKWDIIELTTDTQDKMYEAVVIQPSTLQPKTDVILHVHGGPHSCYPSSYMTDFAAFCKLGYIILSVNYRGSLGFGQESLESLPGHVGTQDVNESKFAIDSLLKRDVFHAENVYVMGGSHGGFLSAHLVGQFPEFFSAVSMRNPALNIMSMVSITDIPDWPFEECGNMDFSQDFLTDADTCAKLLSHSPMIYAKKIKTPTLILLGALDLRVPPSQGKELYRALKARGIDVRLLWYPEDNHPLNKVETEADSFVNTARWFYEHKKGK